MSYEFLGVKSKIPMLLNVQPAFSKYVAADLIRRGIPSDDVRTTPFGVRVMTDDLDTVTRCRLFDRLYLTIPIKRGEKLTEENAKDTVESSMLRRILDTCVSGERPIPCRIRVEVPGMGNKNKTAEKARDVARRLTGAFSDAVSAAVGDAVEPTTGNYECELYFPRRPDKTFGFYLWIACLGDKRFDYRRELAATSMSAVRAATMMEMLHDYLIEGDSVLDPFCGTGTLIIERKKKGVTGNAFGIDISAQMISGARENAALASEHIHFIQRDFFEFTYDNVIDEIITEMPDLYRRNDREKRGFFSSFVKKCMELTAEGSLMCVLTGDGDIFAAVIKKEGHLELAERISFGGKREVFIIRRI
ncbi:MAG: methyltransferase domain-containing protein [Lachnospiraceae bacterium]|nr:methyltransferase domain-containing protein [Lachnospiraceae bacterium]